MPFNFPDPAVSTTATNPVTGAIYQWKDDPGKWVLTGGAAEKPTPPVTIDLLPPENPQKGDLWIHEESLIEYAWDGTQWFEVGSSCAGDTEEEEEVFNIPFVNSYKLVSPDDFTGADGTATLETDAYANGDDSFLSPVVKIARFAELDLNGRKHESVQPDESFELSPTTYNENEVHTYAYGKFEVTSKSGSNEYDVNYDTGRAFKFVEGDTIHYRPAFTGEYVKKKGGDEMEGPLKITGPRKAGDDSNNPDWVSSLEVLSIDNTQNSGLHLRHSGTTKVYVGSDDLSVAADIKFNRGAGTRIKSNVQDLFDVGQNEVAYLGETIEDEDLVTKKYVDDADEALRQDIIELEEEIDAIAPASERGTWAFNPVGNVSLPGSYSMYTDTRDDGLGNVANIFGAVKNIALNERDLDNTVHSFGGTEVGDLLEIFEENDSDYGLYSIIKVEKIDNPNPGGIAYSYISIDVKLERTGNGDRADSRARFKVFKAPTGGDASGFVKKSGDEMSGPLTFETAQNDTEYDVQSGQARIVFENTNPDSGNKRTINLFQPGDTNALVTNGYLMTKQGVYTAHYLYGWNPSSNATYNPRVYLSSSYGGLYYSSSSKKLTWGNAGVTIEKGRSDTSSGNGFIVKGKIHTSSWTSSSFTNSDGSLLESYHNANGQDAINYNGKITSSKNITTKEYVDSKLPTYKITKSNGNYYIQ